MTPPNEIIIKSDGNVLSFVGKNKDVYTYKYKKSISKKNITLALSENDLVKLVENNR